MDWSQWFKYYVLNLDTIVCICIFIAVVYFIFTIKKKKYEFQGLDITRNGTKKKSTKSVKKKKGTTGKKLNKHEEECRRIFQELFGVSFKSVRPSWLKNPVTNKNLELDGFNPTLETPLGIGLGFEYDGVQHSKFTPHFHKGGSDEFIYQVKKDSWKDLKCKEKGIALVRIPHFVDFHDLKRYIIAELARQKIKIPTSRSNSYYNPNGNMYN